MPTDTPKSAVVDFLLLVYSDTQKGVGICSSAHPGLTGLRIAHITQDRQRS